MSLIINLEEVNAVLADASVIKHFFRCEEVNGIQTFTDSQGGIVIPTNKVIVNNDDGSVDVETDQDAAFTSGAFVEPGIATDFAVWGVIHTDSTVTSISFGGLTNNITLSINAGNSKIVGNTGSALLDSLIATSPVKFLITADATGDTTLYQAAIGAAFTATLTPLYSDHGNVTAMNDTVSIQNIVGGTFLNIWGYCYAVLPDDLPADIITAADWMCEQMYLDNKSIYPRLTEI